MKLNKSTYYEFGKVFLVVLILTILCKCGVELINILNVYIKRRKTFPLFYPGSLNSENDRIIYIHNLLIALIK
jgi:hypothetical protein